MKHVMTVENLPTEKMLSKIEFVAITFNYYKLNMVSFHLHCGLFFINQKSHHCMEINWKDGPSYYKCHKKVPLITFFKMFL